MDCSKIIELMDEEDLPVLDRAQIWLHTLFCQTCSQKAELYAQARQSMKEEFFPSSPQVEDSIMAKIEAQEDLSYADTPGVLSVRGWVIAGIIIMVSLVTAYFGMDFQNVARETGTSFLLPVGIIFGIVLTTYGAIFIGSHLKEFSERFGL